MKRKGIQRAVCDLACVVAAMIDGRAFSGSNPTDAEKEKDGDGCVCLPLAVDRVRTHAYCAHGGRKAEEDPYPCEETDSGALAELSSLRSEVGALRAEVAALKAAKAPQGA